jgi:hypothetical protein
LGIDGYLAAPLQPGIAAACFTHAAICASAKSSSRMSIQRASLPVKRRVPLHRLPHVGDVALDEGVEAAPDVAFPARHRGDVGLDGGVAIALRDLGVAACEEDGVHGRPRGDSLLAIFAELLDLSPVIAFIPIGTDWG